MDTGRVLAAGPLAELLARPDLALARQDDASVVIAARVAEHDRAYGLTRVVFAGAALWVGETAAGRCAVCPDQGRGPDVTPGPAARPLCRQPDAGHHGQGFPQPGRGPAHA